MINAFVRSIVSRLLTVTCSCIFLFLSCVNDENEVKELLSKKLGVDEAHNVEAYMSSTGLNESQAQGTFDVKVPGYFVEGGISGVHAR
jgi:hypothetical protein